MSDKRFLPIPLYANETKSDILKGLLIRVAFAGIGYGLSARIMGKEFSQYALYGGFWAVGSNLIAIAYTKHRMKKDGY